MTIDIYEEIDSSDLDFNFMFFEAGKSERLSDQIVPTPEIEESNNDDEIDSKVDLSEDKNEISTQKEINDKVDWEDVGKRAFNWYFNCYRKSENHDECQDLADEEIANAMENFGVDVKTNWEVDLDKEQVKIVIQSFGEKMRDIHDEVGYKVGGVLLWPMHTWITEKLSNAKEKHNDEKYFRDLDDFISNKLPELLPNDDDEISTKNFKKTTKNADENKDKISSLDTDNFFKHSVMLVSIGKSLLENKKIYDAARFAWDAKKDRAEKMDYVIAHQSGKIVGVFKPEKWLFANDEEFADFPKADPKRIGFIGNVADSEILLEYLNKDIPSEYRPKGASNPLRYIELEKSNTQKEKKNKKVKVSSKKNQRE